MPSPVRIAAVRYLNTAPLIEGVDKLPEVAIRTAAPSAIAGMLERDEADVGLVSLVDAVRSAVPLALLPVGMIGCDGPTLTVRVFSRRPLGEMRTLHADPDSHTSVILSQVVLAARGVRPVIARLDPSASLPDAALLIGDKVVTAAPPAEAFPHQLDLGEAWHQLTGLPFVYAMWMCRGERAGEAEIQRTAMLLDRQRRHNATRLGWIVQRRAAEAGWPVDLALHYVRDLLRYEPGPRHRAAIEDFLSRAQGAGLLPGGTPLWASVGGGVE